ncbi:MAG TPA: hypothetical protein VFH68_00085 [Polyangia bacterium]|nr:hypothetical protein [Polyangia bacterium]
MTSGATARAGHWLTAAVLLWVACDVIENKKFPPPPGPPVIDPGYYQGIGGQGNARSGYAGSGYGGYGGVGGGRGAPRPDGGALGAAGAAVMSSCAPTGDSCVSTCFSEVHLTSPPICDQSRGAWICVSGMVLTSSCPPGSCATTFLYCCDTMTGDRQPAGCTQAGIRGLCPASYRSLTDDACIPDGLGVSTCEQLRQHACDVPGQQCHSGAYDCRCATGPAGDGGPDWLCVGPI